MNTYIPYTYLIGWSKHNKFYYGRRTAQNCYPNEFWVKYFTSSKEVKSFRDNNGDPDIIQIRKTFPNNPDACKLWESKVLEKLDAQHDSRFLNKKNGDHKWDSTRMVPVKDEDGKTFLVSNDDSRYISGELKSIHKETVPVKDKEGNLLRVDKKDPAYISGELIHITMGMVPVKDKDGKTLQVSKDDPRYLSGELIHVGKNVPKTEEHKKKMSEAKKGKISNNFITMQNWLLLNKDSKEYKEKLSKSISRTWILYHEDGREITIDCLKQFCEDNNYNRNKFYSLYKYPNRHYKQWIKITKML